MDRQYLHYLFGYPDSTNLENIYGSQYLPTQSRSDREEFLHGNFNSVPIVLFSTEESFSLIGWFL